jgi:hypothetical protein
LFGIELTDTNRLLDAPPIPLSDKIAVVYSRTTAPSPHSGKAKSIDSLEMNHSHLDPLELAHAAFLNDDAKLSHEELAVAAMASNLKVPNAKRTPRNVKKVGAKLSYNF